jgi:branched-chain amino acid transport system substrate-binding protein
VGCARADEAPIRIGVVVGADGAKGAELAIADVRAAGGVDGRSVALVVIPHALATAAAPSITTADSLASDPTVVAVVGHSNSAASLAASQIYNARRLVHIAPTTTAPLFSQAGPYSYRLVPDDGRQAEFLVRQAAGAGVRRVAVVYVNDDYGRGLEAATRARLAAAGVQVVYAIPYLEGADTVQLRRIAGPLVAADPQLVLWLGRAPELRRFREGADPRLTRIPVLASEGVDIGMVYQHPELFPGVRFVRFIDPAAPDAKLQAFRARYRGAYHLESPTEAVLSYDAVTLVAAALRGVPPTRENVRRRLDALAAGTWRFTGLAGAIVFDANGDVVRPHRLAQVDADGVHAVPAR